MAKEELKRKLREALMHAKPSIKRELLYERCVNKYLDGMLIAIRDALAMNMDKKCNVQGAFAFPKEAVDKQIKKTSINQKQVSICSLMEENESTSLIIEVHRGFAFGCNNSMLSVVTLNALYEDLIWEELRNMNVKSDTREVIAKENEFILSVPIDTASLTAYMEKTHQSIDDTDKGQRYTDKLRENLMAAQKLLTLMDDADENNETPYLREVWRQADCGRIYGTQYSLQCMTKEVRNAALGECHKYDFKACAFALMAGLAHAIDPTLKLGATLDYVKNRQKIRERIAKETGIDVVLVKQIFTALGFGAELKDNIHNAIRGALAEAARKQYDTSVRLERDVYNNLGANEYMRLTSNQTFKFIYEELQLLNATILQHFEGDDFEICCRAYSAINPKTGKKRKSRQKLAFIYQAMESCAMLEFAELAQQEPLLTTHDCIYFKHKLNAEQVKDITWQLQQTFMYLRFEYELIRPIATAEYYATKEAKRRSEEQDAIAFEKQQMANWSKEMIALCKKSNDVAADIVDTAAIEATDRFNYIRRQLDETRAQQKVVDTDYEYEYEYDYCTNEVFNY
jgi:hypothetical protein